MENRKRLPDFLKKWRKLEEEDSEEDTIDDQDLDDSDDYPAFEDFINEAYSQHDDQYKKKLDRFMEEGLTEKQAAREA